MIELRGITWDHPRGYAPLAAASREYEALCGVRVVWDKRSLKDFGDADLQTLALDYDLVVMDHPHVGEAAESGCLIPFDEVAGFEQLDKLERQSLGPVYSSYHYRSRQWALPLDAACQVGAYRPDIMGASAVPESWEEVFDLAGRLRGAGLWMGMALCPTDLLCSFLTLSAQLGDPPVEGNSWIQRKTTLAVLDKLSLLKDLCHPDSLIWNPIALFDAMADQDEIAYAPLAFGYINYAEEGFRRNRLAYSPPPGTRDALLGGAGIALSRRNTEPLAAADYSLWVCGGACQSTTYLANGGQPGNGAAWREPLSDGSPAGPQFLKPTRVAMEQAYVRPRVPGWPAFQEALGERVHTFISKGGDPERLHEELQTMYTEMVLNHETV